MTPTNQVISCVKCGSMKTCCNIIDTKYENRKFHCKILCHKCKTVTTEYVLCPSTPDNSKDHISASVPIKKVVPTL